MTSVGFSHWQTRVSSRSFSTDADMLLTLCDPHGPVRFRVLPAAEYFRFVCPKKKILKTRFKEKYVWNEAVH